jgi:hypothetical protein
MFHRLRFQVRRSCTSLRTSLIALLAVLTGCDRKPQWRGIHTDRSDAARPAARPNSGGTTGDVPKP